MNRRCRALVALVTVLAMGAFGSTGLNAICGFPGLVSASSFAGGTGYVSLFSPVAPFAWLGMATVPLGGVVGDTQFEVWLTAISDVPTNYLYIAGPGGGSCAICNPAGPPAVCFGATITTMYD